MTIINLSEYKKLLKGYYWDCCGETYEEDVLICEKCRHSGDDKLLYKKMPKQLLEHMDKNKNL